MMVVMFLGLGAACLYCASVDSPPTMLVGLSVLGAFAAIYHPVGIPWIVRNSGASGKALGVNGIFGGLGMASAGGVTGLLTDAWGWQAAFAVPGAVAILAGLSLLLCLRMGFIQVKESVSDKEHEGDKGEMRRGVLVLLFTMFTLGFVYQANQVAFPKLFASRIDWVGEGTLGVGLVVSAVYTVAALMQLVGGHLADHYPLKRVYVSCLLLQPLILAALAGAVGSTLLATTVLAVMLSTAALPAENMLLARHSPRRHQSLLFGLKFVLALGTAPLALGFVSRIHASGGGFTQVYLSLGALAVLAFAAALALPKNGDSCHQLSA
jgi:MFS family permease